MFWQLQIAATDGFSAQVALTLLLGLGAGLERDVVTYSAATKALGAKRWRWALELGRKMETEKVGVLKPNWET